MRSAKLPRRLVTAPGFAVPSTSVDVVAFVGLSLIHRRSTCRLRPKEGLRTRWRGHKAVITASEQSVVPEKDRRYSLPEEVSNLCSELATRCDGEIPKYEINEPELVATLLAHVVDLEKKVASGFTASDSFRKAFVGKWKLIFTDSPAIIKNGGSVIGIPFPGSRCHCVEVALDLNGHASTMERINVLHGAISWTNTLNGTWTLSGPNGRLLEVTYAEANLFGSVRLRSDSKAVLKTTYVGKLLRVGRSSSGAVFLFERIEKLK